jgi:excisionase family DNA binding protein
MQLELNAYHAFKACGGYMDNLQAQTLTIPEIQKITRLGRMHVQKLVRDGILPNLGTQKRFLVSRAAVTRFLEQGGKK